MQHTVPFPGADEILNSRINLLVMTWITIQEATVVCEERGVVDELPKIAGIPPKKGTMLREKRAMLTSSIICAVILPENAPSWSSDSSPFWRTF